MESKGVKFIGEERTEQIEIHDFSVSHDRKRNSNGELIQAAVYVATKDPYHFPGNWGEKWYKKLTNKRGVEALKVAGALIAAEIDRLEDR